MYYGTPVPHTVAAKSGLTDPFSLTAFVLTALKLPFSATGIDNSMGITFLPSYYQMGGWNETVVFFGRLLSGIVGLAWLLPKVSRRTRLLAFVFGGMHLYMSYFPYYPFPWYIPASTPFAILTLMSLLADSGFRRFKTTPVRSWMITGIVAIFVVGSGLLTWQIARQVKAQQIHVEDRVRTQIGLYLREHADHSDTVQMEPLGYIGFFSGLRTYDFPGMSSPEMVAARKLVQGNTRRLIGILRPDWIVIRPWELSHCQHQNEWRLTQAYDWVRDFDQSAEIADLPVQGLDYLKYDAKFSLYRKRPSVQSEGDGWRAQTDFGANEIEFEGARWLLVHAEGEVKFPVPQGARSVVVEFGFNNGADLSPDPTDGVRFGFEVRDRPRVFPLGYEEIYPPGDALKRTVHYDIPSDLSDRAILRVTLDRVVWRDQDWTMVKLPEFQFD